MAEELLRQKEPLDAFDRQRLKDWLAVLEGDVEIFGPAGDDMARINAIKAKLAEGEADAQDAH